jgi:hypothetical protein
VEVSGQVHTPAALFPREDPGNELNRDLLGPQSWSECFGEEKNPLPLSGFEPRTVGKIKISGTKVKIGSLFET